MFSVSSGDITRNGSHSLVGDSDCFINVQWFVPYGLVSTFTVIVFFMTGSFQRIETAHYFCVRVEFCSPGCLYALSKITCYFFFYLRYTSFAYGKSQKQTINKPFFILSEWWQLPPLCVSSRKLMISYKYED